MNVLILGAGPAGTSCAIQLLKTGHNVIILDRAKFPRSAPGETLHPGIEPLLKQLGVWDMVSKFGFKRHSGIINVEKGVSNYEAYNEAESWMGFQLFRKDFDWILLKKAIELGAEFYDCVRLKNVNVRSDVISSVVSVDKKFEADYFIDATGHRAWLANNYNIPFDYYSPKRIAFYGYVKNSKFTSSDPQLVWDKYGWTWISEVKTNLLAWVRLDLVPNKKLDPYWVPKVLQDGESLGIRKAVDVTWRKAKTFSKNNCFLAGDAAFVLDPGSSHGVLKAIMSGMMIAHLIKKTKHTNSTLINDYYNNWILQQFNNDYLKLKELYTKYQVPL